MGGALLARWVENGLADTFIVIDPGMPKVPEGVEVWPALPETSDMLPDAVVLAVKPQLAAEAAANLPKFVRPQALVVSIMAGTSLAEIATLCGPAVHVRSMPNTPIAIGRGMTALFGNDLDDTAKANAQALFETSGTSIWLETENQFDAVTAVSGSGPAYVFRFIEALAAAAESAGLPEGLSATLAKETVVGAAMLADQDSRSPAELRRAVTSPGGTTQAGLEALDADPGLPLLVRNAVRAAANRSKELGES